MAVRLDIACPICSVMIPVQMEVNNLKENDLEFMREVFNIDKSYTFGGAVTCKHCNASVSARLTVLASKT